MESFAERVLANTAVAGFAVDSGQVIRIWNWGAERLLGRTAESLVGKKCYEVIAGETASGSWCRESCPVMMAARQGRPLPPYTVYAERSDGVPLHLLCQVILDSNLPQADPLVIHLVSDVNEAGDGLPPPPTLVANELTSRQLEVLGLMREGLTSRQIAARLGITYATARNHVQGCLRRLGARSRAHAVALMSG